MLDNIELVDRDSSNAKNAGRIHSNLIRLKKASFSNIVSKWNAFRLANLNKKLERENDKLDKIINTAPFGKMEEKVFAQTNKIAKLEEKIKILSRENVPANYVKSRAIKLKKDMIASLFSNKNSIYSSLNFDSADKTQDIDEASDYGFTDFSNTDFAVSAAVNTNVAKNDEEEELINGTQIKGVLDDEFNKINGVNEEQVIDSVEPEEEQEVVEPEEIVSEKEEPKEIDTPVDFAESVEEEATVEEVEEPVTKVSTNEASPAKIDAFDNEGARISRKDIYTPMSDEEVARARKNIEYERYKNGNEIKTPISDFNLSINKPTGHIDDKISPQISMVNDDDKVRDDVIVIPDREEKIEDYEFADENKEEMHFDYTDATAKDLEKAVDIETSNAGLQAILARVAKLKEEQAKSKAESEEAKRIQEEEAQRALEAKNALAQKQSEYQQMVAKLNDYADALEEDVAYNRNAAAIAMEDAESNKRFILDQENKSSEYDRDIDKIRGTISPEAVNVRLR